MTQYVQGKDGKFAGSVGTGKTAIPTPSTLPQRSTDKPKDPRGIDYNAILAASRAAHPDGPDTWDRGVDPAGDDARDIDTYRAGIAQAQDPERYAGAGVYAVLESIHFNDKTIRDQSLQTVEDALERHESLADACRRGHDWANEPVLHAVSIESTARIEQVLADAGISDNLARKMARDAIRNNGY